MDSRVHDLRAACGARRRQGELRFGGKRSAQLGSGHFGPVRTNRPWASGLLSAGMAGSGESRRAVLETQHVVEADWPVPDAEGCVGSLDRARHRRRHEGQVERQVGHRPRGEAASGSWLGTNHLDPRLVSTRIDEDRFTGRPACAVELFEPRNAILTWRKLDRDERAVLRCRHPAVRSGSTNLPAILPALL